MTHTVIHEIAWRLLGASTVGPLDAALRQPVIVCFIAVSSSADTTSQIRLLVKLGVTFLFLVGLNLVWRLIRMLGSVAPATSLGHFDFTTGLRR